MEPKVFRPREIAPYLLQKESEGIKLNMREKYLANWSGATLEQALTRSNLGCESCAKLIRNNVIPIIQKQTQWGEECNIACDVTGPFVDPGNLTLGIPEACVYPYTEKKHILGDQGVDIILNASVSSYVETEVMRARGILVSAIALSVERLGLASRIFVSYAGGNYRIHLDNLVKLKDYNEPLDIPLLAFYTISPASPRIIGFSLDDIVDPEAVKHSYYMPSNTRFKTARNLQIIIDHGYIRQEMTNPELAVASATEILRNNGVIR